MSGGGWSLKLAGISVRDGCVRLLLLLLLALLATGANAQQARPYSGNPVIMDRSASITVNDDRSITVSETTRVDLVVPLPFHRDIALGNRDWSATDVVVLSASADGNPVPAQVGDYAGGVRITLGTAGARGMREYKLMYRIDHAVVHYANEDRLDWPVVSRSNPFALDEAEVHIMLPEATPPQRTRAWFRHGRDDLHMYSDQDSVHDNKVLLYWPHGLGAEQTLSVAVSYVPGGVVPESAIVAPGPAAPPGWMFDGRVWLALLVVYYLLVRFVFARPDRKALIPEYGLPHGYSAAALRMLWNKGYDSKCLATGILGVAAKGGLRLGQQADGTYVATRDGPDDIPALTIDERALRSSLFTLAPSMAFTAANADGLDLVETRFRAVLGFRGMHEPEDNQDWLLFPGWLITLAGVALLFFADRDPLLPAAELVATMAIVTMVVAVLIRMVPGGLLRAIRVQAVAAALICIAAWIVGSGGANAWWVTILMVAQMVAGWWVLQLPSGESELTRKIRGFRWYLGTAEQQDMDARYRPSLHPDLHESFLPYAMALDVEVAWNRRFAETLQQNDGQGFVDSLNQDRPGHTKAALDLLAFARALAESRVPTA